jgi:flagellar hook-basal body complex protein FliE
MNIVLPNQGLPGIVPLTAESPNQPHNSGFSELLGKVNEMIANADTAAADYAQGKVGLTEAVLAAEKADTTFQVLIAVRNRALAAYQEIMNLQV